MTARVCGEAEERERIAKMIAMDLLNAVEATYGMKGLERVVGHAKAAQRARQSNAEIDALDAMLSEKE